MSSIMDSIMEFDNVQEWLNKTILLSNNFESLEQAKEVMDKMQQEYYDAVKDRDEFIALSEEEKMSEGEKDRLASIEALTKYVNEKQEFMDSLTSKFATLEIVLAGAKNDDLKKLLGYIVETLREDIKNNNDVSLAKERLENVTKNDAAASVKDIETVKEFRVTLAKNRLADTESLYRRLKAVVKDCNSQFNS